MYVEYKCGNGLPWQADDHHVLNDHGFVQGVSAVQRNYELFGLLASVRTFGPRKPLGLPRDISDTVKQASDTWAFDAHSHSYMSLDEFKKVLFEEFAGRSGHSFKFKPTKCTNAFFSYDDPLIKADFSNRPEPYSTLVAYCEELIEKKSVDKQILGKDVSSEVQVRLIFWFDS
jgi:hypothetical protein